METSTKQKILTILIVIAVILLILIGVYVVYQEENIKTDNKVENKITNTTNNTTNNIKNNEVSNTTNTVPDDNYIGKEEEESNVKEDTELTTDEKALKMAKERWGEDDSVTFNIEKKNGNIYIISVNSNATTVFWYQVNTKTWEISDYY